MGFEKPDQRLKQGRVQGPGAQLIRPNSGHIEEPLRPARVGERCAKRKKSKCDGIDGLSHWPIPPERLGQRQWVRGT